jgi:hypothetical protein
MLKNFHRINSTKTSYAVNLELRTIRFGPVAKGVVSQGKRFQVVYGKKGVVQSCSAPREVVELRGEGGLGVVLRGDVLVIHASVYKDQNGKMMEKVLEFSIRELGSSVEFGRFEIKLHELNSTAASARSIPIQLRDMPKSEARIDMVISFGPISSSSHQVSTDEDESSSSSSSESGSGTYSDSPRAVRSPTGSGGLEGRYERSSLSQQQLHNRDEISRSSNVLLLRMKLHQASAEAEDMNISRREGNTKITMLESELKMTGDRLAEYRTDNTCLVAENNALREHLLESQAEVMDLTDSLSTSKRHNASDAKALNDSKMQSDSLSRQLYAERDRASVDAFARKNQISDLTREVGGLKQQLADSNLTGVRNKSEMQEMITKLTADVKERDDRIEVYKSDMVDFEVGINEEDMLINPYTEAHRTNNDVDNKSTQVRKQIYDLRRQNVDLNASIAANALESDTKARRIADLESELLGHLDVKWMNSEVGIDDEDLSNVPISKPSSVNSQFHAQVRKQIDDLQTLNAELTAGAASSAIEADSQTRKIAALEAKAIDYQNMIRDQDYQYDKDNQDLACRVEGLTRQLFAVSTDLTTSKEAQHNSVTELAGRNERIFGLEEELNKERSDHAIKTREVDDRLILLTNELDKQRNDSAQRLRLFVKTSGSSPELEPKLSARSLSESSSRTTEVDTEIRERQHEVDKLEQSLSTVRAELSCEKAKCGVLLGKREADSMLMEQQAQMIETLQYSLEDANAAKDGLAVQVTDLIEEENDLHKSLSSLTLEKAMLKKQLDERTAQTDELRASNLTKDATIAALEEQLAAAKALISAASSASPPPLPAEDSSLTAELLQELQIALCRKEELIRQVADGEARCQALESKIFNQFKSLSSRGFARSSATGSEIEALRSAQNDSYIASERPPHYEQQVRHLQGQVDLLKSELSTVTSIVRDLQMKMQTLDEVKALNATLAGSVESLRSQLGQLSGSGKAV